MASGFDGNSNRVPRRRSIPTALWSSVIPALWLLTRVDISAVSQWLGCVTFARSAAFYAGNAAVLSVNRTSRVTCGACVPSLSSSYNAGVVWCQTSPANLLIKAVAVAVNFVNLEMQPNIIFLMVQLHNYIYVITPLDSRSVVRMFIVWW